MPKSLSHAPRNALYLHPRCHPQSPTWSYAVPGDDNVYIECAECRAPVARLGLKSPIAAAGQGCEQCGSPDHDHDDEDGGELH